MKGDLKIGAARILVGLLAFFFFCAKPAAAESLSRFVSDYAAQNEFNGVILISAEGRASYTKAFGVAERAFGTPMSKDGVFKIASITKLFTSSLVLKLAEKGAFSLDDPVAKVLPEYPGAGADRMTIRQLLNHTSGIEQFDKISTFEEALATGVPQYQSPATSEELLSQCCSGPLRGDPGAQFDYNNADYIVLGRIIEVVTKSSFDEALQAEILGPLGLMNTGVLNSARIESRLARTYFYRPDLNRLVDELPFYWENCFAAGAMYSTAADLSAFADALFGGRVISLAMLKEMLAPGLDEYGLGIWSYDFERQGRHWSVAKRPGAIMGAKAVLYRLIEADTTIILLANTDRADLDEFAQKIAEKLIDRSLSKG